MGESAAKEMAFPCWRLCRAPRERKRQSEGRVATTNAPGAGEDNVEAARPDFKIERRRAGRENQYGGRRTADRRSLNVMQTFGANF